MHTLPDATEITLGGRAVPWFKRPIPRLLFHGSQTRHLESIKKHGLLAGTRERANHADFAHDVAGLVSLTDTPITARRFALYGWKGGRHPDLIVLEIDTYKAAMIGGTKFAPMRGKLSSDYGGHEYLAVGNIPRDAVIGAMRYYTKNGQHAEEHLRL